MPWKPHTFSVLFLQGIDSLSLCAAEVQSGQEQQDKEHKHSGQVDRGHEDSEHKHSAQVDHAHVEKVEERKLQTSSNE